MTQKKAHIVIENQKGRNTDEQIERMVREAEALNKAGITPRPGTLHSQRYTLRNTHYTLHTTPHTLRNADMLTDCGVVTGEQTR